MRVIFLLIFYFAASFGELDFNSKTRNFSIELLYHTVQDVKSNVMISPFVIWSLLISMAYETLGVTREEFSKVFSLTEDRSEVVEEYTKLRTAVLVNDVEPIISGLNFVFYDENFNVYSDSIKGLESDFGYIVRRLSFQEPQQAADSAQRLLRSYRVPSISMLKTEDFEESTMIMCSYCSFQAEWLNPFNVSNTSPVYYYDDGKVVGKIEMMYMKSWLRFSDFESLHASVTELPYRGGGKYCMLLVRPHKGYDVAQVLRNLREVSLKDVLDTLQRDSDEFGMREVEVKLPSIGIVSRVNLNRALINMGLSDGFDQKLANFDKFTEDKIYIGEITQRFTFTLNPFMTTVHTFTPAYSYTSTPSKSIPVKEPFLFFIMEKSTATVLFGGSHSKINIYEKPHWRESMGKSLLRVYPSVSQLT